MKKYIPRPGVPKPTPKPGDNKGEGTVKPPRYVGKPVPVPSPTPKPKKTGPKEPRSNDTIKARFKPDGTRVLTTNPKGTITKRRDVSDEQLVPLRVKPTPNRRRFLEQLNEMNKKSR